MVASEETALVPIETRALAQFDVTPEAVADRVMEFENLHLVPGDAKSYKQIKGAYMTIVHLRNKVDARRKVLGEEARKWTNALSAAAKKLIDPTAPLETRLRIEIEMEDTRLAVIEAEKVQKEKERVTAINAKIDAIQKRGFINPQTPLSELNELFLDTFELDITEVEYQEYVTGASLAKEQALAALKIGIAKREAWEKEQAAAKVEAERLEKVRQEQEAERQVLDTEKRKLEEEKAKIEAENEAKAKAEREAKEAQEKTEREALEKTNKERKLKEAAEYAERIQPDKKKIISFVRGLLDHAQPQITEKEAQALFYHALSELKAWADMVIEEAEKL